MCCDLAARKLAHWRRRRQTRIELNWLAGLAATLSGLGGERSWVMVADRRRRERHFTPSRLQI
jgi:hypothetical protein